MTTRTPRTGRDHREEWRRARTVLESAVEALGGEGAALRIESVEPLGRGLSRVAFACTLDVEMPGDLEWSDAWPEEVVVVLSHERDDEELRADIDRRTGLQADVLAHLGEVEDLGFDVPALLGCFEEEGGSLALVCGRAQGAPLELRAGRGVLERPWEVAASLLAEIHAIPCADWYDLPGFASRRDHGLDEMESIIEIVDEIEEGPQILDWAHAHLPEDVAPSLTHGDLLGHNILVRWEDPALGSAHYTVIDWEYARCGDPAYDFAVMTEGARAPFLLDDGLARLLDAYHRAGGEAIDASRVRFYELCLTAHWYAESLLDAPGADPLKRARRRLRGVFQRARRHSRVD
jgi:aminoglycoside phosphotransferase (APT) family kinase protein